MLRRTKYKILYEFYTFLMSITQLTNIKHIKKKEKKKMGRSHYTESRICFIFLIWPSSGRNNKQKVLNVKTRLSSILNYSSLGL